MALFGIRRNNGRKSFLPDGETLFKMWMDLGSWARVADALALQGIKNPDTGVAAQRQVLHLKASIWLLNNMAEAKKLVDDMEIARGNQPFSDDEWRDWCIVRAKSIFRRTQLVSWCKRNGIEYAQINDVQSSPLYA